MSAHPVFQGILSTIQTVAPIPPPNPTRYSVSACGAEWEVEMEIEPECKGSWCDGRQVEPDEPLCCTLQAVYLNGRDDDIQDLLADRVLEEIRQQAEEGQRADVEDPDMDWRGDE